MSRYMYLPNGKLQNEVSARVYRISSFFTCKNFEFEFETEKKT